jgi:hypothetical protein
MSDVATSVKPTCKLVGEDGNVFNVIGRVRRALRQAGEEGKAAEFTDKAFRAESYDRVLQLAQEYVDVV